MPLLMLVGPQHCLLKRSCLIILSEASHLFKLFKTASTVALIVLTETWELSS